MKDKLHGGASKEIYERAKKLRGRQTHAEELLWNYLRTKPLGCKFRRQHPFFNFILDFYCFSLNLVIEVDGSIHDLEEVKQKDLEKEDYLKYKGLSILRFTNEKIRTQPETVF